ncbi:hypothetical protein ACH5RR_027984 [Cinchona calisaya]|uniref:RRM domain-containing protein n=1 Tax=Cinchona calisaya TaxID=153742 RepID=A0ABD2YNM9_9GENT
MAMRAAVKTAASAAKSSTAPRGPRSLLFSTSNFPFNLPQTPTQKQPPAEPSTNLFISGLNKRTTTEGLKSAFEKFGQLVDAKVITDRVSGFSKGYGFVRYSSLEDTAAAIKGMDGQFLDGWVIFAEYARPRTPSLPPQNSISYGVNNTRFQS